MCILQSYIERYIHVSQSLRSESRRFDCTDKRARKYPSLISFSALSALKMNCKERKNVPSISKQARICGTNIHLASKLLIDVLFNDWGKGTRDLFTYLDFFPTLSLSLWLRKYGRKYSPKVFLLICAKTPYSKFQSVSMMFKRFIFFLSFSLDFYSITIDLWSTVDYWCTCEHLPRNFELFSFST